MYNSITMAAQILFLTLILFIFSGDFHVCAASDYDHFFTPECLAKPLPPQYGGGIVNNSQFDEGLKGWGLINDNLKVEHRRSIDGNNFMVAPVSVNRTAPLKTFFLEDDKLYAFSAWAQVKGGEGYIQAVFETQFGDISAGWVMAKEGCWSMLKGGTVVNVSGPANLVFESNDTVTAEVWVDNISLRPFTYEEWSSHQDKSVEKVRKNEVKFVAVDRLGQPIRDAKVSIKQIQPNFPFGSAINQYILNTTGYAEWFLSRGFRYTVFENELKWILTEPTKEGVVDYSLTDTMVEFVNSHGLITRGHTALWAAKNANPTWVAQMNPADGKKIKTALDNRIDSVMTRYKGQFFHWDVVNENLHNTWLEDTVGPNASTIYYQKAHELDPNALLFLNDYFTIEKSKDNKVTPLKYLEKISTMRAQGYQGPLAIGLQGHFSQVNLPYVRASIDVLKTANLPIWVTELDVSIAAAPHQALYLEQLLRELHAHEAVDGIMMWTGWWPNGNCYKMCLTDDNFNNLPTGEVVDKIIAEWTYGKDGVQGATDAQGQFMTSLFHGEYEATIIHPQTGKISAQKRFIVAPRGQHLRHRVVFEI